MPLDLATLRNDKAFDALTAAILDRDQPRTTDLFYKMVTDEGRSVGEALSVVTAAEAPFVQVPNHINVKDGQVVLVNNDHTILGLRTSADLAPYLPEQYRLLPMLQSVWYIPAGLDIWNQLAGQISRPLRHHEGHERAAAGLRPRGVEPGRRADPRRRHAG